MTEDLNKQEKLRRLSAAKRTALGLGVVALLIYVAFVLSGVIGRV